MLSQAEAAKIAAQFQKDMHDSRQASSDHEALEKEVRALRYALTALLNGLSGER